MNYPKINIYTDTEGRFGCEHICFSAKNISLGNYPNNGFLVLPHLEKGNPRTVYFPDLNYSKEFWKAINVSQNMDLDSNYSQKAIDEVKLSLREYKKNKYEEEINKIKQDWEKMEKEFFEDVGMFLDFKKALEKVKKINVLLTPFGTRGSFHPPRVGNQFNLNVTSRIDFPAGNIAANILQNLYIIETWNGGEIGDEKYTKRMATISFLMKSTIFKKYYPDFGDITKTKFTANTDLIFQSNNYLEKLGVASQSEKIFDKLIDLTSQEQRVLNTLKDKVGQHVTFDQMGEVLWGDKIDEKYSLSAMAKVVENLRKKIKAVGVNKEVIFTKRGKGYTLLL